MQRGEELWIVGATCWSELEVHAPSSTSIITAVTVAAFLREEQGPRSEYDIFIAFISTELSACLEKKC